MLQINSLSTMLNGPEYLVAAGLEHFINMSMDYANPSRTQTRMRSQFGSRLSIQSRLQSRKERLARTSKRLSYQNHVEMSTHTIWAASWQNQQNGMCAQWRLRSTWASAQSDQSSLSTWRKLGSLATHWAHSEDWLDWADAQADLSLRWAHMPFCWFCHEAAQVVWVLISTWFW